MTPTPTSRTRALRGAEDIDPGADNGEDSDRETDTEASTEGDGGEHRRRADDLREADVAGSVWTDDQAAGLGDVSGDRI